MPVAVPAHVIWVLQRRRAATAAAALLLWAPCGYWAARLFRVTQCYGLIWLAPAAALQLLQLRHGALSSLARA